MYGEFPEFEPGTTRFSATTCRGVAATAWSTGTAPSLPRPCRSRTPGMVADVLDTVSHEFFHAWNVERIRPKTLEPFNFEEANISGELWLAEGFTQYYGPLIMGEDGAVDAGGDGGRTRPRGRLGDQQSRTPVSIGRADEPDGAVYRRRARGRQDQFLDDLHLVLHVRIRHRAGARPEPPRSVERQDLARRLHARDVAGPRQARRTEAGLVGKPYTLADARARLAEVSGDRAFADEFFDKYVEGREVADYARLLLRAGYVLRKRSPGAAWMGPANLVDGSGTINSLLPWGSPAFDAGLDQGDVIIDVDGKAMARWRAAGGGQGAQARRSPHGRPTNVAAARRARRRSCSRKIRSLEVVTVEATGGTLTPEQKAFREAWLGSKLKP